VQQHSKAILALQVVKLLGNSAVIAGLSEDNIVSGQVSIMQYLVPAVLVLSVIESTYYFRSNKQSKQREIKCPLLTSADIEESASDCVVQAVSLAVAEYKKPCSSSADAGRDPARERGVAAINSCLICTDKAKATSVFDSYLEKSHSMRYCSVSDNVDPVLRNLNANEGSLTDDDNIIRDALRMIDQRSDFTPAPRQQLNNKQSPDRRGESLKIANFLNLSLRFIQFIVIISSSSQSRAIASVAASAVDIVKDTKQICP
jgi:hypothetical protein